VSGSDDGTVRTWDAISCTIQHTLEGHTGKVTSVTFSSDGLQIVSGSYDQSVRTWDAISGTTQFSPKGHTHEVTSVAFSSDGLRIVSGSRDYTVRTWDANTGAMQYILPEYNRWQSLRIFLAASTLQAGGCTFSLQSPHRSFLILILQR
jgi:WD40 repeat protein